MVDRPILFSASMVRANLADLKSQTRRILKPQPEPWKEHYLEGGCQRSDWVFETDWRQESDTKRTFGLWAHSAFHESRFWPLRFAPGDRLWVRETWTARMIHGWTIADARSGWYSTEIIYRADGQESIDGWWPSIHMPREFSRLTLTVTAVKVERLQDISEEDAKAEGLTPITKDGKLVKYGIPDGDGLPGTDDLGWPWDQWCVDPREAYRKLWEYINGPGSWEANPWVAAISYRVYHCNIDQLAEAA